MNSSGFSLPSKACHNCRRKRWKCDRSLPVCHKCLSSGQECLGYGKLFIWADGIASRGKMMGRSYEARSSVSEETRLRNQKQALSETQEEVVRRLPAHSYDTVSISGQTNPRIHWPLVDPVIQNLDGGYHDYLVHFATKLCADMVAYDAPGRNPMRDLVPATPAFPYLLHIMIANSAFHVYNISRDSDAFSTAEDQDANRDTAVTSYRASNMKFYKDALTAKQKALSLLARSVTYVDENNFDLVLAAILLFINYDLIESGKDQWKPHMDGAHKLIKLLANPSYRSQRLSTLRTCLLSDFLVFYILGTTFRPSSSPKLFPDSVDVNPILEYAETNNYLSCPAPLLRVMLQSFTLSESWGGSEELSFEQQERVKELLELALSFKPLEWLSNFKPASPQEDLSERLHMASAHRSAVCIYLVRFLPCSNPLLNPSGGSAVVSLTGLADDVVHHISQLKAGDTLFKSISWPLFLAGAESEDPAQRAWILKTLDCFYTVMRWGYIQTVKRVLEAIWRFKDEGADMWATEVKKMGTEMLIA